MTPPRACARATISARNTARPCSPPRRSSAPKPRRPATPISSRWPRPANPRSSPPRSPTLRPSITPRITTSNIWPRIRTAIAASRAPAWSACSDEIHCPADADGAGSARAAGRCRLRVSGTGRDRAGKLALSLSGLNLELNVQGQPLRQAYMDVAPTGTPNGRVALLFHGRNFPASYWKDVIAGLAADGYRVIATDQIG